MKTIPMLLTAGAVVGADQLTKAITTRTVALGEHCSFIPGLLGFTYVRNDGAAFSSFRGMQWLFALLFAVLTAAIIYEYVKKKLPFTGFERLCILLAWAGGLGNMIDRVRFGYVVDMIETLFVRFPVFNVADCFITCAGIALVVHLAFFNKAFWKDEKKHDSDS